MGFSREMIFFFVVFSVFSGKKLGAKEFFFVLFTSLNFFFSPAGKKHGLKKHVFFPYVYVGIFFSSFLGGSKKFL